ncbi:MAG: type IV secretory system conjugative DNA transfer family protein [Candidatus Fimousia sp.]
MKKKSFKNIIIYYNIIPLFLLGIGFIIFRNKILDFAYSTFHLTEMNIIYKICRYTIDFIITALLIFITFLTTRRKRYRALTGRNFSKDRSNFNKTYRELVQFFTHNDPYKMDINELPIEDWHYADGVILCKYKDVFGNYRLVKRDSDANGNLISFGLPGSGKSTTQAATTAIRFNVNSNIAGGVFAISIKGDLLNFVRDKRKHIKVFTPDKETGSCHYDPLLGLEKMSWTERRVFAENLSIIICPDESGDNAAFFVGGARDYLSAIILYLLHLHDTGEREGNLKFPEIVDMILQSNVFDITMTIHDCKNTIPGEYTNGYIGSSEKNISGVWSHICKCVRPFNSGALRTLFDGEGDCITPEDLNTGDIYIDVPQDKYDVYAPCMAIIVTNFLQAFMRRDDVSTGNKITPIMFLLDEAVQLNLDYSILSKAMSTLRSKKVSLFLLMQSVAQLEGRYGEAHAREIIDLCSYISVFNAQDPKSREYFQKLIGRRKMLRRSTSLSSCTNNNNDTSGISISEIEDYIFEAADFGNLNIKNNKTKKSTQRVLVYANGKYIIGETTPCYK